jgi:predicted DNA-binding protein
MSRDRDEAEAALANQDWSTATVDDQPRPASVAVSVRLPRDLSERLFAEAERRGTTPSEVIRDLVDAGLTAVEESATVRLADVQRALNTLARPRRAA